MPVPTNVIQTLKQGLIVSCQAPVDSPLHEPNVVAAMAQAAVNQGASGVRIDTPDHVSAVRQRVKAPLIGLWKQIPPPGYDVYITPQLHHAVAIAAAGADIIAIDATLRSRPGGDVATLIRQIHDELGKLVMADVDTIDAAIAAAASGADLIATTLYGYTAQTNHLSPPGFDLLAQIVKLDVPAICEGGISSPQMARYALELGAYAVVVGTAITGIDYQVKAYRSVLGG